MEIVSVSGDGEDSHMNAQIDRRTTSLVPVPSDPSKPHDSKRRSLTKQSATKADESLKGGSQLEEVSGREFTPTACVWLAAKLGEGQYMNAVKLHGILELRVSQVSIFFLLQSVCFTGSFSGSNIFASLKNTCVSLLFFWHKIDRRFMY